VRRKIEPPLLGINLKDDGFVKVDGHHTVEAYKGAGKVAHSADIVAKVPNCPAPIFLL
jgi:hypothetical protein